MPSPPLLVLCIPCTSFLTSSSIVPLNMGALNVCSDVALDCTFTQAYNSWTITVWQEAVDDWHLVDLIWRKRGKGRAVEKKEREIVQRHWGFCCALCCVLSLLQFTPLLLFLFAFTCFTVLQKERPLTVLICDSGLQGKRSFYLQEVLLWPFTREASVTVGLYAHFSELWGWRRMKLQGNKDLHTVDGEDRAEKEAGGKADRHREWGGRIKEGNVKQGGGKPVTPSNP